MSCRGAGLPGHPDGAMPRCRRWRTILGEWHAGLDEAIAYHGANRPGSEGNGDEHRT